MLLAVECNQAVLLYENYNLHTDPVHPSWATLNQSRCDRYRNQTELIFILEKISEYSGQKKVKYST